LSPFKSGLVVSGNSLASKAGANILKKGGNAVDAAITTAHVLGVAAPAFSGIGGGGFALIWLAREEKAVFVDFREKAPAAATEDMFKLTASGHVRREKNAVGYKSVAVPGAVAGHELILEKYGTLELKVTLDNAASIARRGFPVGRALAYTWKLSAKKLQRYKESRSTFLRKGRPYREGDHVTLPTLSTTLRTLAREGAKVFYGGSIARKIADDITGNGGLVTANDLENYEPTIREPLHVTYKNYEVISAPPPSAGGAIIIQSLNMLEGLPLKGRETRPAERLHMVAEVLARSSSNCQASISDPAFVNPPMEKLLSRANAKDWASTISLGRSSIPADQGGLPDMSASNTTHLVAIDAEHNVVSLTESVECYFGSGVTVPGIGILLNDTMHDFEPRPRMLNSVVAGKIPMSSMSPTIILKEGRPVLALGAAGGPRIVSSTFQTLLNVIEYGMTLRAAVAAPRIHVNGRKIELEDTAGHTIARELREMGHHVEVKKRLSGDPGLYFGGVHAVQVFEDGTLIGAPDPRRDGVAVGLLR
jgi:gamma-glutamyltranspeptidase/glutathione hydrolase